MFEAIAEVDAVVVMAMLVGGPELLAELVDDVRPLHALGVILRA